MGGAEGGESAGGWLDDGHGLLIHSWKLNSSYKRGGLVVLRALSFDQLQLESGG